MAILERLSDLERPREGGIPGTAQPGSGHPSNEFTLQATTALTAAFFDTAMIALPCRIASLLIVTTGTITYASGQSTIQLFSARTAHAGVQGAATALPYLDGGLVGAAVNLGPSSTTLTNRGWWFTVADFAALQWPLGFLGLEFKWGGGAPSQGSVAAYAYGAAI